MLSFRKFFIEIEANQADEYGGEDEYLGKNAHDVAHKGVIGEPACVAGDGEQANVARVFAAVSEGEGARRKLP